MRKPKAAKARRSKTKNPKAAAKKSTAKVATKKSKPKIAAKKRKSPAKRPKIVVKKTPDPVELDSRDSFPASDPPSWVSVTGEGAPDRSGRKRRV